MGIRSSNCAAALIAAVGLSIGASAQPVVDGTLDASEYTLIAEADTLVSSLGDSASGQSAVCPPEPGLIFDAGFEADLFLSVNNSGGEWFVDSATMETGGGGVQECLCGDGLDGMIDAADNTLGIAVGIDNTNVGGVDGSNGGPSDGTGVTTGFEFIIPLSSVGNPGSGDTVSIAGGVNNGNRDFWANQFIGGAAAGTANVGGPPQLDFASDVRFPGDQFVNIPYMAGDISAMIAADGVVETAAYGGAEVYTQTLGTGFGDNFSEVDGVWAIRDDVNIYVTISGNLEANGNRLELWLDTQAGGQNEIIGANAEVLGAYTGAPGAVIEADNQLTAIGSEIDGLYATVTDDTLYLFVSGNLDTECEATGGQDGFNLEDKLLVLIDGNDTEGVNTITALGGTPAGVGAPIGFDALPNGLEGMVLETGFNADLAFMAHAGFDSAADVAASNPNIAVDMSAFSATRGISEYGMFAVDFMANAFVPTDGLTFESGMDADFFVGVTTFENEGPQFCFNFAELATAGGGAGAFQECGARDGTTITGPVVAGAFLPNGSDVADPTGIGTGMGATAGNPADVTKGIEFQIPLSELGNPAAGDTIQIVALLNNGGHDFLSNQALPGYDAPRDNVGEPTLLDLSAEAGDQSASLVVPMSPAAAPATLDGVRAEGDYNQLAVQTIDSQFNGSDNENELNNLHAFVDNAGNLNVHIGGSSNNKIEIFIDSIPGGQSTLRNDNADLDFNGLNRLGGNSPGPFFFDGTSIGNGNDLDNYDGFFAATTNRFGSFPPRGIVEALEAWEAEPLPGGVDPRFRGDGTEGFARDITFDFVGVLDSMDSSVVRETVDELREDGITMTDHLTPIADRVAFAHNNSNTGGISDTVASGAGVTTGFEIAIDLREINHDGGDIKVMVMLADPRLENVFQVLGGPNELGASGSIDFASLVGDQSFCISVAGCPCEFGGDAGSVDVTDLLGFLSLWFPSDPGADINGGGVDVTDLLDFLACWFPASSGAGFPGCE